MTLGSSSNSKLENKDSSEEGSYETCEEELFNDEGSDNPVSDEDIEPQLSVSASNQESYLCATDLAFACLQENQPQ